MYIDASSVLSSAQAITATAVSTGVYDTAGLGIGQPVTNRFGTATNFGDDLGGGGPLTSAPQLGVWVTTAFAAAGAGTLQVQLQAAVDVNNSGNPTTWDTIMESDTFALASLILSTPQRPLISFTVPDRYPGQNFPRFYRLNYVVGTGPMTAGAVNAMLLTGIDDMPFYPPNF
jgi:hypothetical protein